MGRAPCCDKNNVKKGPWSPEEDAKLKDFIEKHGTGGNWIALPQKAGLRRCGKSCRLRWLNYLRPNIKHGEFTEHEDRLICSMFASIGSRWSIIASELPGRTDNDIKNYWNTKLKKKLLGGAVAPLQRPQRPHHRQIILPHSFTSSSSPQTSCFTSTTTSSLHDPLILPTALPQGYNMPSPCLQMPNAFTQQFQAQEDGSSCSNMIVFGSDQSCSSSEGNLSQFGHGKEMSFDQGYYPYSTTVIGQEPNVAQEDQALPLEYNYDEIKQLLMSSNTGLHELNHMHQH